MALLDRVQVAGVSVPIAIGLLWMMYPVLAKVRFESIGEHITNQRLLGTSLFFNWVLGPVLNVHQRGVGAEPPGHDIQEQPAEHAVHRWSRRRANSK